MKKINSKQNLALYHLINHAIHFFANEEADQTPSHVFEKTWNFINNNGLIDQEITVVDSDFCKFHQLNIREYLLFRVVDGMRSIGIDFSPEIVLEESSQINDLVRSNRPFFIASVHNGFAFPGKIITDLGRNVSTISSDTKILHTFARSGIKVPINIIKNDRYCLGFLKKSVADGEVICCCIDHRDEKSTYTLIDPNLFKFCQSISLPIVFLKSHVLMDGRVLINLMRASENSNPDELASDFIGFLNASSLTKRVLFVREYSKN